MPRTRPPYPKEFREQIVALARAGRSVSELAEEFEPSDQTIRTWPGHADRDQGHSDIQVTQRYAHLAPDVMKSAMVQAFG